MWNRVWALIIKEFIQVFRDPRMLGIIFFVPIIQTLVFGYAVTMDVKRVTTAVYDLDQSATSRELIDAFQKSGYFDVVAHVGHNNEIEDLLDYGTATAVINIEDGFEKKIIAGHSAPLQIILDGSDANTAGIVQSYVFKIVQQVSQRLQSHQHLQDGVSSQKPVGLKLESRAWFNENLESRNFYVPGVIAIMTTILTLMLTGMSIVREKELGTIEQILVTPITRIEFMLGKTIPFIIISFIDILVIIAVAIFWFEVPFRGNLFLLLFSTSLYLLTTLGIGLFMSTISQTQQQALMGAFLLYLPTVLFSGFIFPIANMPIFIQWLTYLNPLRYFLIIIRGIFLKGLGWEAFYPHLIFLGIAGVVVLGLASLRFKKTIA